MNKHDHDQESCPGGLVKRTKYIAFLSAPPTVWFACKWSLSTFSKRKNSPAVVALVPGATARVLVKLHNTEEDTAVALQYLASYVGMGRVSASCGGGCACALQIIDAHRPSVRASTWVEHEFKITPRKSGGRRRTDGVRSACILRLVLLNATSSNATRFSVRLLKLHSNG